MKFIPFFRQLSHSNSTKKIISRTPDDNAETEFTNETFSNRKGSNIPDLYGDKQPEYYKFPVKPNKGGRKFKGSKTIRKPEEE